MEYASALAHADLAHVFSSRFMVRLPANPPFPGEPRLGRGCGRAGTRTIECRLPRIPGKPAPDGAGADGPSAHHRAARTHPRRTAPSGPHSRLPKNDRGGSYPFRQASSVSKLTCRTCRTRAIADSAAPKRNAARCPFFRSVFMLLLQTASPNTLAEQSADRPVAPDTLIRRIGVAWNRAGFRAPRCVPAGRLRRRPDARRHRSDTGR